jgi:hypothetical protein
MLRSAAFMIVECASGARNVLNIREWYHHRKHYRSCCARELIYERKNGRVIEVNQTRFDYDQNALEMPKTPTSLFNRHLATPRRTCMHEELPMSHHGCHESRCLLRHRKLESLLVVLSLVLKNLMKKRKCANWQQYFE